MNEAMEKVIYTNDKYILQTASDFVEALEN